MKTILVVDDNPANLGLLFNCLDAEGFRTLVAQDGAKAVEMASRSRPDLILLDVIMPEMDGFEICRRLKQAAETRDIPVIFMTALADTESKVNGFACGALDYISKPFHQEEVIARINTHLTLQEQKEHLLRINREKEKIIAVVAHDLKGPFQVMFSYLQMLTDSYDRYTDERRKMYIQRISASTQASYSLVETLLNWVMAGDGTLEFSPGAFSVKDHADLAVSLSRNMADRKDISLDLAAGEGIRVFADANMIAAVLRNLVANAVKFTPRGGRVWVGADQTDGRIRIWVRDSGVGMTREMIDNILWGSDYESRPGTELETGTGLGLVICKEFVEKNNGTLEIESRVGQGSKFTVTLPGAPPE
ncbi:MAG: hybrid sensor histidine kinase/response regulator [Desulfobacteraceae bacterium]|nr:hybrid sensor histidine kinase/response regulator [Desulfobacteraceae bacterium]